MNWVVIASFIVCLATFSKGNALRGTSESKDAAPPKDEEPIELRKTSIISEISETSEAQCLAGSEWTSNCHSCRCSKEGVAKCTRLESCEGRYAEPITCKPQTKFLRDCNMCMCLENGKSLCTLRLCIKVDSKTPISDKHDENKSDLNYDFDDHKVLKRSSICKPNALIKTDCNFCKCASDGQSYSCTLNVCEEPDINDDVEVFKENEDSEHDGDQVDGKVCKPRATFHIGCNTCHCNFDGTTFTCTNKPCPLPDDVELFHELRVLRSSPDKKSVVCAANRMFIKDCNTCWCNEDGTSYYCTRKVCVTDAPDILEEAVEQEVKRKCIPDEVFELDCNTCRCSQDGMSFSCTRKACIPEEKGKNVSLNRRIRATSQGTPKTCTPGQEFRMDCNKCLCNDEGQDFSCTRIDCTAINNNGNVGVRAKRDVTTQIQLECAPGSVFKQGCNLCHCTEDGKHATCALKRCTEKDTQEESLVPESDPSFRCNPGEQTKRGCNDCSCSADGKSVFCTLRFCDQDITPTI